MKGLYLILAATAVAVMSEPQSTNNDIIWYPVDDDDGIFISTYGEKRRTSPDQKSRNHRRVRRSGVESFPSLLDPTENQDPSFFHNIRERRPFTTVAPIPKVPPAFLDQDYPVYQPDTRPQVQGIQNNYHEIINEVFGYNRPSESEFPGVSPGTANQWGNGGQRPVTNAQNQWGSTSSSFVNGYPGQQSAAGWGGSRPVERPTSTELIVTPSNTRERPNRRPTTSKRPTGQADKLVFPGEVATTTPSADLPTERPTMSPCEKRCPVTPEFNPVCGSDKVTYSNAGRLKCAQLCGKNVRLSHYGNCGRSPLATPLVSNNRRRRFRIFL